jgi:hypothetical protein
MTIPLNRIVAFAGPYLSIAGGGVATWIVAKMNLIGVAGLDQGDLAQKIAAGLTFTLTAVLSWLGHMQWLKGHHQQMAGDAQVQAAALAAQPPRPTEVPPDPAHDALMALDEELPDDDEEFALPPDQDARITPEFPAARPAPSFAEPQFAEPQFAVPSPPQQFTEPRFATAAPAPALATPPPEQPSPAAPPAQPFVLAPQSATAPPFPDAPSGSEFPA